LDKRLEALKKWSSQVLGVDTVNIGLASADASFRRYFRITQNQRTLIAMDAPPDRVEMRTFVDVARRFQALGLNVPDVLHENHELGFLLISDLGQQLYLPNLNEHTVEHLYGDAMKALIVLQAGTPAGPGDDALPAYDATLLMEEMELFRVWYLGRHRGIQLSPEQHGILDAQYALLVRSALSQPRAWVHRDYHSRNLLVTPINNPGILDFQDAVLGPVTYDLVSLLRDCYIAWPHSRVEHWVRGYFQRARDSGVPVGDDEELFLRWFDFMGVQRHLKASGIFARLNHRDAKPGYLADIPRTLQYVYDVSRRYSELQPLYSLLEALGMPVETRT